MPGVISHSPEIHSRKQFAALCNARKFTRAVEVGTDRGTFAEQFLRTWTGSDLFCVDTWEPYWEMPWSRDPDYQMTLARLAPFVDRVRIMRTTSLEAAKLIPVRFPIEFAYLDGAHDYESIRADMAAWWDKLYPKGPTILAGHDYDDEHPGVRRAVKEFADERHLQVYLTREGESPASWYIYRNSPERLMAFESEA